MLAGRAVGEMMVARETMIKGQRRGTGKGNRQLYGQCYVPLRGVGRSRKLCPGKETSSGTQRQDKGCDNFMFPRAIGRRQDRKTTVWQSSRRDPTWMCWVLESLQPRPRPTLARIKYNSLQEISELTGTPPMRSVELRVQGGQNLTHADRKEDLSSECRVNLCGVASHS